MKLKHEPTLSEVLQCARICHEVNRAYCFTLGDTSQSHWGSAPHAQEASIIAGVRAHITSGLTMTPQGAHESWLKQKKTEGWKYGPVKDADKKQHPCFMAYNALPEPQKTKDWLFRAAVHAFFRDHFED